MPDQNLITKPERPVLVTIISWVIFLQGILSLISIPLIIFAAIVFSGLSDQSVDFLSVSSILLMGMLIIIGLLEIILSFGLRAMKKWTIYTFLIITILQVISLSISKSNVFDARGIVSLAPTVLSVGIVIYLLAIRKKFV